MFFVIGILSGILSVLMYFPYARDILKGTTRPERASWLIWSVLGLIAVASQAAKGATDSLWMTVAQTAGTICIFGFSLKYGYGGLIKRDIVALIAAGFGLVLWFLTKDALYALMLVIIIDGIGAALTVVKAYEQPESETVITWILGATSAVLGTIAVGRIDPILMSYPFYVFLANVSVLTGIYVGFKRKRRKKNYSKSQ